MKIRMTKWAAALTLAAFSLGLGATPASAWWWTGENYGCFNSECRAFCQGGFFRKVCSGF